MFVCETAGVAGDANVIYGREEEEVQIMVVGGRKKTRTVVSGWKQSKGSKASVVVGELMNLGDKHSRISLRPAMDQWRGEPPRLAITVTAAATGRNMIYLATLPSYLHFPSI